MTRKKSSDLPWLSKGILKLIQNRKKLFISEGGQRTDTWKAEKKRIDKIITDRKRGYMNTQRAHLLPKDSGRNFASFDKPKLFDVRSLLPDLKSNAEIAAKLASYFKEVSREFDPLQQCQIPSTTPVFFPRLKEYNVAKRIKGFMKFNGAW